MPRRVPVDPVRVRFIISRGHSLSLGTDDLSIFSSIRYNFLGAQAESHSGRVSLVVVSTLRVAEAITQARVDGFHPVVLLDATLENEPLSRSTGIRMMT